MHNEPHIYYAGRVVKHDDARNGLPHELPQADTPNAETNHLDAADAVLAQIHDQAEHLRASRFAEIEDEYERRLAEMLLSATRDLSIGLDDVAGDLVAILGAALMEIIGDTRDPQLLVASVKRGIRRHKQAKSLEVRVAQRDFDQMHAAWFKAGSDGELGNVTLLPDDSLSAGRCLLIVDDRRFEVGLAAQLSAFNAEASKTVTKTLEQGAA